jgi:hypothetical protein
MAGSSPVARTWSPRAMSPLALITLAFAQRVAFGIVDRVSAAAVPNGGRARNRDHRTRPGGRGVARLKSRVATGRGQSGPCCDLFQGYHHCSEAAGASDF